jgi:apolipoprotein N-acyltransferase
LASQIKGAFSFPGIFCIRKTALNKLLLIISAVVLSAGIYTLALPPLNAGYLAWLALVPLLAALRGTNYTGAFLAAFLFGVISCAAHVWWLNMVPAVPFSAYLMIVCFGAFFFAVFGLLFRLFADGPPWLEVAGAAFAWTGLEYLRSNLGFLSVPWVLTGYTQYEVIPVLQVAALGSVFGVSFLVILINASLVAAFLNKSSLINGTRSYCQLNNRAFPAVISILLVLGSVAWGWHRAAAGTAGGPEPPRLSVALIQGNIPQYIERDQERNKAILERYKQMSREVARKNPDLIVWPETATPGYLLKDKWLAREVAELVVETGVPYLMGSSSARKAGRGKAREYSLRNSAFMLGSNGKIISSYDKMHLLPFAEYLPLGEFVNWPKWLVPVSGKYRAGDTARVFALGQHRFGVVICWENLFPRHFRSFVAGGADFMVNLTNEAWFERTWASRQLLAMSVYRAVENGVPLLRSANTGISVAIDPYCRIVDRVTDEQGEDLMVAGSLLVDVPPATTPTVYRRFGEWPLRFFLIAGICVLVICRMLIPAASRSS